MSERVEVLEIDLSEVQQEAEATGKTVKDLRAEVKELRATFENTEIGTDEFGKALTDLTKKQQELTNVTKSGIAAQKGSYNDLVNQMALLKMQWRSTADEQERAALGDQIYTINARLKEMDSEIGNFQRNVGNYRMELKQLKEEMLYLEEGTEEYTAACARAAEISQKMQDVNEFVAASADDLGDHLANVTGVAAGMVGAFQTLQASLNLIGVESENVEKMIATMQNLMAITQGLTAVEGAIDKYKRLNETIKGLTIVQNLFGAAKAKSTVTTTADTAATAANTVATTAQTTATGAATTAQWSLNAAIAANPLGALLIAITAVVTALVSLTSWLIKASDDSEDMAAANDRLTKSLADNSKEIDYNIQMLQALGYTRKEALQQSLGDLKKNYEDAYANYLALWEKGKPSGLGYELGLTDGVWDSEQEQIDKAYQTYLDQVEKYNETVREINLEATREQTAAKKRAEEEQLRNQERAAQESLRIAEQTAQERLKIIQKATDSIKKFRKYFFETKDELAFELSITGFSEVDQEIERLKRTFEESKAEMLKKFNETAASYKQLVKQGEMTEAEYLVNKERLQEEYNSYVRLVTTQFQYDKAEIEARYQDEELKQLRDNLKEKTDEYKLYRDRVLRNIYLIEETAKSAFENIPVGSTAKAKIRAEEIMLETLKRTYTEQLKLVEAQDNAERAAIQEQIDLLEAREAQQGLLHTERELLEQLRDQYTMVGAEAIAIGEKLEEVTTKLSHIDIEITIANLEGIRDGFDELRNTFNELNDITGAWSDEWSKVFDSIITGIDTACTSLREMDSVIKSNASETEKAAAKWKGYGQMAAAGLSVAANLMGALADEQDKTTEEGFERSKKFQIAQAVMSTLAGVASAWASSMQLGPIAGPIMGAILSAMMLTMGGLQIANIKKQKFDSGGEDLGGATSAIPSLSAVNAMGNPVQTTTTIEGASAEGATTDTRVYVLESDITTAQSNVKTTVDEATF
jgi:predicted  nucleic acid-binding Zn-ribbon protein